GIVIACIIDGLGFMLGWWSDLPRSLLLKEGRFGRTSDREGRTRNWRCRICWSGVGCLRDWRKGCGESVGEIHVRAGGGIAVIFHLGAQVVVGGLFAAGDEQVFEAEKGAFVGGAVAEDEVNLSIRDGGGQGGIVTPLRGAGRDGFGNLGDSI